VCNILRRLLDIETGLLMHNNASFYRIPLENMTVGSSLSVLFYEKPFRASEYVR